MPLFPRDRLVDGKKRPDVDRRGNVAGCRLLTAESCQTRRLESPVRRRQVGYDVRSHSRKATSTWRVSQHAMIERIALFFLFFLPFTVNKVMYYLVPTFMHSAHNRQLGPARREHLFYKRVLRCNALQGRRSWKLCGLDPLKICRRGQSMFDPLKCHILSFKTIVG